MSAEAAPLTRSWPVGHRTCTLTMPRLVKGEAVTAVFEWSPDVPRQLSAAELHEYRTGRDAAIASLGLNVVIADL